MAAIAERAEGADVLGEEVFMWNDAVHIAGEAAGLQFWRFAFAPDYDRDAVLQTLATVFKEQGITSYIGYELFGTEDLLLRLWVPKQLGDAEDLGTTLESVLKPYSLWTTDYMVVRSTELHWLWESQPGAPRVSLTHPDDILDVNNLRVNELHRWNAASFGVLDVEPYKRVQAEIEPPEWVGDFEKRGLLRRLPLTQHGVRFFVTFDHPTKYMRREEKADVARRIHDKCVEVAAQTKLDHPELPWPQLSLYVGNGPMTDFLILARAPDGHFYSFARRLIYGLRALGLSQTYHMRTYTHVIADRNFSLFQELPCTPEEEPATEELLARPESEALELKSTYAANVRRHALGQGLVADEALVDAIVRAVCGLLNAPRGGHLVIGVLEVERELERTKQPDDLREFLVREFPLLPGSSAPDDRVVTGLQLDYQAEGTNFTDWDTFARVLNDTLRARITPLCIPFVSVKRLNVAGRTVAVITVRASEIWFYARGKDGAERFYVRELAATRAYTQTEAQIYKSANPRASQP